MAEVFTGKVARWFGAKGFGFVRGEDGQDVFVHVSQLTDATALLEGQQVQYEVGEETNRAERAR